MEKKFEIIPYTKKEIITAIDLTQAKDFLLKVKEVRNAIETERTDLTKPILSTKKKLDDKYKVIDEPFKKMELEIKSLMADYLNRLELEIKKDVGKDVAKLAVKDEKVSFRINYNIEVTDITKVSKDFLLINEQKIQSRIKEGQKIFAGIKITEIKVIIAR